MLNIGFIKKIISSEIGGGGGGGGWGAIQFQLIANQFSQTFISPHSYIFLYKIYTKLIIP